MGSEMCIRDRPRRGWVHFERGAVQGAEDDGGEQFERFAAAAVSG